MGSQRWPVLRIELWHASLLVASLLLLVPLRIVEPRDLLLGGLFMGVNFFLLSCGVRWVLTPFAASGRIRAGVFLLIFKFLIFLGLLLALFFRFELDPPSFALGVSCLLVAIVLESLWVSKG